VLNHRLATGGTKRTSSQATAGTIGSVSIHHRRASLTSRRSTTTTQSVYPLRRDPQHVVPVPGNRRSTAASCSVSPVISRRAALSSFAKRQDGSITGSIPHPFFFNTPRTSRKRPRLRVERSCTSRRLTYCLEAVDWRCGRPSICDSTRSRHRLDVHRRYPYDTRRFGAATIHEASPPSLASTVSAAVGIRLSKCMGVGGLVRFSRRTVDFPQTGPTLRCSSHEAGGLRPPEACDSISITPARPPSICRKLVRLPYFISISRSRDALERPRWVKNSRAFRARREDALDFGRSIFSYVPLAVEHPFLWKRVS